MVLFLLLKPHALSIKIFEIHILLAHKQTKEKAESKMRIKLPAIKPVTYFMEGFSNVIKLLKTTISSKTGI